MRVGDSNSGSPRNVPVTTWQAVYAILKSWAIRNQHTET
jgi:hypothetical protein